ncbi:hypothetical protein NQ318_016236, partial [Aromia moschata]
STLFRDKTTDLQNQTLKVTVFSHIPGTTKINSIHEWPVMWAGVTICLILTGFAFFILARFHIHITRMKQAYLRNENKTRGNPQPEYDKKKRVVTLSMYPQAEKLDANVKYTLMREKYLSRKVENYPTGLYQFSEPINSILYTYSMLLLVSLPKLPTGWSLRILTGWYWLYCLLLVTSYRASMTAILAKPTPRSLAMFSLPLVDRVSPKEWGKTKFEILDTKIL